MKALTVRQPFASRIVAGRKTVENRSRRTSLRGLLVVHAGAQLHDRFAGADDAPLRRMPLAAVLGTVQLVDSHVASLTPGGCCEYEQGPEWPEGEETVFHWVLRDPVEFVTPIPRVRGALGFWEPEPTTQHLISISEAKA